MTGTTDLVQLATGDRRVARELALAERDRATGEQRIAAENAAADRQLRIAEGKVRLAEQRDEAKTRRVERRRTQREAERKVKRARRAVRRQAISARINGWVDYARDNAPAVYSAGVYGLAVGGAVYGQIDAATAHGMPMLVGIAAAAAIEGTGLSMALTAHQLRMRGERAIGPRLLIWLATATAVGINYFGHADNLGKAAGLSVLSAIGIVVYEIRSAAKHRAALRKLGLIPEPPERFGWRRWVAAPGETWDAWRLDARTRVGTGAASLIVRAAAMRAERAAAAEREAARAEVMRVATKTARKAARKGDAGPALAALMHLANTGVPAPQLALSAEPEPLDDDTRRLLEAIRSQPGAARMRLFGSAPAVAPRRLYAPAHLTLAAPPRRRPPANEADTAPTNKPDSGPANEADTKAPTAPDTAPDTAADTAPAPNRTRRTTSDPTRRPDTAAARVAKLRAKQPDIKQTDVARRLNITIRTVQRVWADTAPATKHDTEGAQ